MRVYVCCSVVVYKMLVIEYLELPVNWTAYTVTEVYGLPGTNSTAYGPRSFSILVASILVESIQLSPSYANRSSQKERTGIGVISTLF